MSRRVNPSSLQWVKDRIIESGAERWARPVWMKLAGRRPSPSETELAQVMAHVLKPDSTYIDVGAHKGLVLDISMRCASRGTFYAFEPIPYLAGLLRRKYRANPQVKVYELALADTVGTTTFHINKAAMGFSSLKAPSDPNQLDSEIEACTVSLARLDDLLPQARPDLIKIDVEGAELGVLRGAFKMLERARPVILFEHGLGGADRFGTTPEEVYDLLASVDMRVSRMAQYLGTDSPLSRSEFSDDFHSGLNSNFIAYSGASASRQRT